MQLIFHWLSFLFYQWKDRNRKTKYSLSQSQKETRESLGHPNNLIETLVSWVQKACRYFYDYNRSAPVPGFLEMLLIIFLKDYNCQTIHQRSHYLLQYLHAMLRSLKLQSHF